MMFKWIKGFVNGMLVAVCAGAIAMAAFCAWTTKELTETPKPRKMAYSYYYHKERSNEK